MVDLSAGRQMQHPTAAIDGTPHAVFAIDAQPVRQAANIVEGRKLPPFAQPPGRRIDTIGEELLADRIAEIEPCPVAAEGRSVRHDEAAIGELSGPSTIDPVEHAAWRPLCDVISS